MDGSDIFIGYDRDDIQKNKYQSQISVIGDGQRSGAGHNQNLSGVIRPPNQTKKTIGFPDREKHFRSHVPAPLDKENYQGTASQREMFSPSSHIDVPEQVIVSPRNVVQTQGINIKSTRGYMKNNRRAKGQSQISKISVEPKPNYFNQASHRSGF